MSNAVNGTLAGGAKRPLRPGVYSPVLTFFQPETEDLDLSAIGKHAVRLVRDGLVGLVTMGSNGEAVHLNREERRQVTATTRQALDEAGFRDVPLIVGAADASVRESIELCKQAAAAGGDYALVIPPSYYRNAMNDDTLYTYFTGIADKSPIPVLTYNYPGAVAGIDMDSDLLINLAEHPNIVGTKFTCGNTGKLTRVAAATDAATPSSHGSGYMALGGMGDFTLQTMVSGGSGVIAGSANVFPKVIVRVFDLFVQGKLDEAQKLQKTVAHGDWILTKAAIPGTKAALQHFFGYGGVARRPLPQLEGAKAAQVNAGILELMRLEQSM